MKTRCLLRMALLGLLIPAAMADILDDMKVPEEQFYKCVNLMGRNGPASSGSLSFLGIPLSDAHVAGIEENMTRFPNGSQVLFREGRGEFAEALAVEGIQPLDQVRLLVRLGRMAEARAAIDVEWFARQSENSHPPYQLLLACRPLEDTQSWEALDAFLALLSEKLVTPDWRAALWSEQLDLAWHHNRVDALLEATADDFPRLLLFHDRLGNDARRDELATKLLEGASPARVIELLYLVPDCPLVLAAAKQTWNLGDLPIQDRLDLFKRMTRLPQSAGFLESLTAWLAAGGDAKPLAGLIWKRWSNICESPTMAPTITALVKRHPDEPTFQLMAAIQAIKSDPARATGLCEKVAAQPLKLLPAPYPRRSFEIDNPRSGPQNLALVAISELGNLNRQDLIRARLDAHPDWPQIGAVTQARYLEAGKMDVALVDAVLDADLSQPENDALAWDFAVYLRDRLRSAVVPRETAGKIIGKFAALAAGSPQKSPGIVMEDARQLISAMGDQEADGWQDAVHSLIAVMRDRDVRQVATLEQLLKAEISRHSQLKDILPEVEIETSKDRDITEGMMATGAIQLFAPPEIRRIALTDARDYSGWRPHTRNFNGPSRGPRLELLDRWYRNFGNDPLSLVGLTPGGEMSPIRRSGIQSMMRLLGPENNRCFLAEIAIATGRIECGDPELKARSKASFEALMAGTKEARGTEAFRYSLLEDKADAGEERMKILNEMKTQAPAVRQAFLKAIEDEGGGPQGYYRQRQNPQTPSFARRELGLVKPATPQPAALATPKPAPDPDLAKLRELFSQGTGASPEGVELAKRIVSKFITTGASDASPISPASQVLIQAEKLDETLNTAADEARTAGMPEVDVLRGLMRVDSRTTPDRSALVIDHARKIIAIDPSDTEAAQILLRPAAAEKNVELLLTCIRALGPNGFYEFANEGLLKSLGPRAARTILDFVLIQDSAEKSTAVSALSALHGYFLSSDPALAAEFRSSLASNGKVLASIRLPIAGQLLDVGDPPTAVDAIARCYVTAPEYPGFPYQFPPKPGKALNPQAGYRFSPDDLKDDLAFLREHQLFAAVIDRIEALGSADPDALATLRMAESPTDATFEEKVRPILERKVDPYRGAIINDWIDLFTEQPESSALILRLLEERVDKTDRYFLQQTSSVIKQAALLPGGSRLIAKLWPRLLNEAGEKSTTISQMRRLLLPMLAAADDATWENYWAWYSKDFLPVVPSDRSPFLEPPGVFVNPARIRQVLPRWISSTKERIPANMATAWALVAAAAGDSEMIQRVRAKLPDGTGEAIDLCDLALGNTMPVEPTFQASSDADGDTQVEWNLVTLSPAYRENGGRDVPLHPFTALDGKFEILITAASDPQRPVVVMKIPNAASAGHVRFKLAPNQHHLAMVATDPTSGAIRTMPQVDLRKNSGLPLPQDDEELVALGFERLPSPGPGGMPAWKFQLSKDQRITLFDRPWTGLEPISVSGWVLSEGKLQLRCLDAAGKELQSIEMIPWESSIPAWQFRTIRIPETQKIPVATVRVVLCATTHGVANSPDFAFSGVRIEIGPPAPMPPGFEKIGRLAETVNSLALSPDASHLAASLDSGNLAIFDVATGIVVTVPVPQTGQRGSVQAKLLWLKSGLYLRDSSGNLFRLNDDGEKLDLLPAWSDSKSRAGFDSSFFAISADGKWLITTTPEMKLRLISGDGSIRRELKLPDQRTPSFTADGLLVDTTSQGKTYFLKNEDLAAGEFVEIPTPAPQPEPATRVRFDRDSMKRDADGISIPQVASRSMISTDKAVYFVDAAGNVIRATP